MKSKPLILISSLLLTAGMTSAEPLRIAVEYSNHAAGLYVAREKGWLADAGLEVEAYEAYVTGMALAAALARGEINAAYLCLVPAITAYANASVPIRIVAGTHRDGYGLVVDPEKVGEVLAGLPVSEIDDYKRGSLAAARELNAENETVKLGELLTALATEADERRAVVQDGE